MPDLFTFLDRRSFLGAWWLPGQEHSPLMGVLSYEPRDSITLVLAFPLVESPPASFLNPETLVGITEGGQKATLHRGYSTHLSSARAGEGSSQSRFHTCTIAFERLVLGEQAPLQSLRTSRATFRFQFLEYVLGSTNQAGAEATTHEIAVPTLDATLRITRWNRTTESAYLRTSTATVDVSLVPRSPRPLAWYDRQLFHLHTFFSFLAGRGMQLAEYLIRCSEDSGMPEDYLSGQILYPTRYTVPSHPPGPGAVLFPCGMAAPFVPMDFPDHLKDFDFAQALTWWLARAEESPRTFESLFAIQYNDLPMQVRFILLTQALESYHRSLGDGSYLSDREYSGFTHPLRAAIPDEFPDDLKTSLSSCIKHANEYSLRTRLRHLFEKLDDGLSQWVAADATRFVQRVIQTRNHLTHSPMKRHPDVFTSEELFLANARLHALLVACIAADAGFQPGYVLSQLQYNDAFRILGIVVDI